MIRAMRDVIVAANWKMHTTPADAGDLARTIAARTRVTGVTRVICPPFVSLAAVRDALAEHRPDGRGRRPERPSRAPGRLHRRDLGADAGRPRDVGHRRPLGATPRRRRDRRADRPQARAGDRRRPAADPVRRRAARRARGRPPGRGRRSTARAAPSPATTAVALDRGRPGHRLRAGLGDRDGPQRERLATPPRWPARSGPSLPRLGWERDGRRSCRSSTAAA